VFSILGISHFKEYRLGVHRWGELAGAVGYQQVILFVLPCWRAKISVCTFYCSTCNTNRMVRGLAFTLGKKRNTNSYPLSRQVFGFIHSAALKWATPHVFEKIVATRGGE